MATTCFCDFCGKSQHDVRHLIAGCDNKAFICSECVAKSVRVIFGLEEPTAPAAEPAKAGV